MNLLFVCTMNKHRSKTAEHLFDGNTKHTAFSRGLDPKARKVLMPVDVDEADMVFCFERWQAQKIKHRFRHLFQNKPLVCLYIEDEYEYGEGALVKILRQKLGYYLGERNEQ